jgi:Rrf2 family cysteine metabolism transcriptional repressor
VKLSVKTVYACRVMAQIARLHGAGKLAHVESLSRLEAVPPKYLAQIMSELREGGLITSRRGKAGGYALARSAEEISLADIAVLMEGDLLDHGRDYSGHSGRRVAQAWKAVRATLIAAAKEHTLDQLVAGEIEEMYYI